MDKLKTNKYQGSAGLHPLVMKECIETLSGPLAKALRKLVDTDYIPNL